MAEGILSRLWSWLRVSGQGTAQQAASAPKAPASSIIVPRSGVVEPAIRAYISEWTPSLIRAAELQADGGSLRLAADLCEGLLLCDDRVKATLDTRTDALLGLPLSFDAGRGRRRNMAARAIEAGEDWWAAYPEADLKLLQAWGLILGVGLARQSWVEHGERIIPRIVVHSPRNLRWDWTSRQWYLTVADEDAPGTSTHEIEIDPTSGEWILYTPYSGTAQRPWQYGAWRALARPVAAKVYARRDFASYSERLGQGVWLVTGATGPQQKEAISADLASLGRNASLAIDAGFDLKLIESTARTWEAFQRQIELCDLAIAITLLGQNLTTENTGGSQAATSEHGRVALAKTKADAETLSTCLHDQSLTWWAMFNFGSPEAAPWPVWRTTPAADLKDMAGTLQMLSQAVSTLTAARAPVDVRALLAQYQIPLLDVPPPVDAPEPGTPDPTPEVEPSAPEASPSSTPSPEVTTP